MRTISYQELQIILEKHKRWLNGEYGGERANLKESDLSGAELSGANLRVANLRGADLRGAELSGANLRVANLRGADLRGAELRGADLRLSDLRDADLRDADLRRADLRGADIRRANMIKSDLDFSCLPLWCGGLDINIDDRQAKQIAYHLVRNVLYSKNTSKEAKEAVKPLVDFANGFHRVEECGKIEY